MQDALLLLERTRLGDGELVAQLDERLGLDEQRLPGVRGVVHDPGQVRAVLRAHGEDVAVAAHRVVGVAQHGDDLLVLEHLLQALLDGAMKPPGALAQLAEQRAGRIQQLAARVEGALQLLRQREQLGELLCPLEMKGRAVGLREAEPPRRIARADEARDLHQLGPLQRPFPRGAAERGPHVGRVGERQLALMPAEQARLLDQPQLPPRDVRVLVRHPRSGTLPPHRRAGAGFELAADPAPAELAQRLFVDHPEHAGADNRDREGRHAKRLRKTTPPMTAVSRWTAP